MSVWESANGKWGINYINADKDLSFVGVKDIMRRKNFEVDVEHIMKGDMLIWGEIADKTYDRFITKNPIPKYLQEKISELINEKIPKI